MTTDPNLLCAILCNPADTVLRLVLADKLEERGDPRAEFIRVQCELAEMESVSRPAPEISSTAYTSVMPFGHDALRARERELLESHWSEWKPAITRVTCGNYREMPTGIGALHTPIVWFRRGFVERVECRLEDWRGNDCPACTVGRLHRVPDCQHCRGTGRIGCHGTQIVLAAPVVEVRVSDKRPLGSASASSRDAEGGSPWFRWTDNDNGMSWELPAEILKLLPTGADSGCCRIRDRGEYRYTFSIRDYDTEAAAHAALSRALVAWARDKAGLPALEESK